MKNLLYQTITGQDNRLSAIFAVSVLIFAGLGCFGRINKTDAPVVVSNDTKKPVTDTPAPKDTTTPKTAPKSFEKADASRGEIPEGEELQEMTQKTLIDFNDAVQADDFTDFFQTISKLWQRQSSPAKLKSTFQVFVDRKIDISDVKTLRADFTSKPRVDDSKGFKELILEGTYDTSPNPTKFQLKYTPESKNWKLTGIMVDNTK